MRIEADIKLDFQDVLLKPKRSTIASRKEVCLRRTFSFKHTTKTWTGIPIISANMTSVTTMAVATVMMEHDMLPCFPKNEDEWLHNVVQSYGLSPLPSNIWANFLCLDVANGYMEKFIEHVEAARAAYPDKILIAGNVVTAEMTEALILAGADAVKIGLGSGAACATRLKTGVGYPQLSAVIECSDAAHGLGGHIVSDGGCITPGDIAKAFAAGADFVMLGGMLAGHDENGQVYRGSSTEVERNDYRAVEGWELKLPARGKLADTLREITGGLRSACSYCGARTLKDLPKCATFVRVNRVLNDSLLHLRTGQ